MVSAADIDTIVAIATPPGRGGIGIIRLSGANLAVFFNHLLGFNPEPRKAQVTHFLDAQGQPIDQGIVLLFPAPNSFTGENVLELHGHGGPVVMDSLQQRCVELGARIARPGEFSERAFLNDKIDLAQAEAIADLIDASSKQAAQGALKSLQGEFSGKIHALVDSVINLRIYVEAAIDFPDEEIDFLSDGKTEHALQGLIDELNAVYDQTRQGNLLQEGMTIVLAGKPNAGKSSLLNRLSGRDSAIVTPIPGTTRDTLREVIQIDGLPLHIIDTAGLRESRDVVEEEGVRRAWREIQQADRVLYVIDSTEPFTLDSADIWSNLAAPEQKTNLSKLTVTYLLNKVDISGLDDSAAEGREDVIVVSAKTGFGIEKLVRHLKDAVSFQEAGEGTFTARRRHIEALEQARAYLLSGQKQLVKNSAGELLAEDLRQVQNALSSITGEFTQDDLLGKIFSSFCIGK